MIRSCAEVVKLVDAVDSKSTELLVRAGSIPAFGTRLYKEKIRHSCYQAFVYDLDKGDPANLICLLVCIICGSIRIITGMFSCPAAIYNQSIFLEV